MSASDRITLSNLRGDLFGGVTAAVVSLPMALTFGAVSGAGAQAGLYGAVVVGFFAAVFGGSRTLISEPTGPMTVLMTAIITRMIAANPEHGLAMAFTVVMVAGVFQILLGALRLGRYITLMPYSVVSGFMSGIGVLLILTQIGPLLGHPTPGGGAIGTVLALPGLVRGVSPIEIGFAAAALAIMFLTPARVRRLCPPHLIAIVIGTAAAMLLVDDGALRVIGEIPGRLPRLVFPRFTPGQVTAIIVDGGVLALLGAIDSLLTAMISDSLTRDQHDSNRELIGQGIANIASGLVGGLPGAGATMGTVVTIQTGARTPMAGILRSCILFVAILALRPLLSGIPMAVLAAIAVKVGVDILDWSFLGRAHRISWAATTIMWGVLLMTVFVDLIVAVGVGVFVANILTIEKLTKIPSARAVSLDPAGEPVLADEERAIIEAAHGRIVFFHLSGPMIFGVAQAISREHAALQGRGEVLVLDLADISMLGTTVALALENVVRDARGSGKRVIIAGASPAVADRLRRVGALEDGIEEVNDRGSGLREAARGLSRT